MLRCSAGDALADETGTDEAGESDAQDGQRQPCRNLVDRKPERHQCEDERHQCACDDAEQRADKDRAGQPCTCKATCGADDHHALDAEIEHAGAFGYEFAGRRDQEWRRGGEHREVMASMSSTSHLSVRENQLEAVEDEGIAGEHVEQQDALKNLCHVQRDLHRDLRLLAADKGQREKKACN